MNTGNMWSLLFALYLYTTVVQGQDFCGTGPLVAYNPKTQGCCDVTIYNLATQGCCANTIYTKATQGCCVNTIYTISTQGCCASTIYTTSTQACCGSNTYNTGGTQSCCGTYIYDNTDLKCCNGKLVDITANCLSPPPPPSSPPLPSPSSPPSPSSGGNGDPHFHGADASRFDFSGVPNTTYCLLSDKHIVVNAYFGGYYKGKKLLTWMRDIGILWEKHSIVLKARKGADTSYNHGYMGSIVINGKPITLSNPKDRFVFGEGMASVSWLRANISKGSATIDVYSVQIDNVLLLKMELLPDLRQSTETDGTVHFDIMFVFVNVSNNVHGILGQTYRADRANKLSGLKHIKGENAEGYLDGTIYDYNASSITAYDCNINRFETNLDTSQVAKLTTKYNALSISE